MKLKLRVTVVKKHFTNSQSIYCSHQNYNTMKKGFLVVFALVLLLPEYSFSQGFLNKVSKTIGKATSVIEEVNKGIEEVNKGIQKSEQNTSGQQSVVQQDITVVQTAVRTELQYPGIVPYITDRTIFVAVKDHSDIDPVISDGLIRVSCDRLLSFVIG